MEHATCGRRIRNGRQARGLTAAELAKRAGISENAVRKIESGDSKEPRFSTGVRIAHALGVDPAVIAGEPSLSISGPSLAAVVQQIRKYKDDLAVQGVAHVFVFGSVARGDATPQSDVDVMVRPADDAPFSLFNLANVSEILRQALQHRVDVVTERTLRSAPFGQRALDEGVHVF